jgi:hypothetical protein
MALLLVAAPMAYADTEGGVGGAFKAKNKLPEVTALVAPDMTPQAEWTTITVTVEDKNKLIDVQEVHVEVFYDAPGTDLIVAPVAANTQTCAILTATRTGPGAWGWTIAPAPAPDVSTWDINAGGCSAPADTLSSGTWTFSFKVGKVATESADPADVADWDAYAKARDTVGWGSTDLYDYNNEMNWWGEIGTPSPASVDWGEVEPDTGFTTDNVNVVGAISIKYIANGDYDQKVKSSDNWSGGTQWAILDTAGTCANPNEFALKADDDDTIAGAPQLDTSGVSIDNTGALTPETGNTELDNHLWLKLASIFSQSDAAENKYTGIITYAIVNR